MKKRLLILLFGVFLSATFFCSSHSGESEVPTVDATVELDAAAPKLENWQKFSQENWSLSIPNGSWEEVDHSVEDIKVAIKETNKDYLILFSKEQTIGTLPRFATSTLQIFTDNGAKIYSVYQQSIDGNQWVLTQMTRNHQVVWYWITVKNGFGYDLACVNEYNPDAGLDTNRDFCQSIANTIQIN